MLFERPGVALPSFGTEPVRIPFVRFVSSLTLI
jgi:hypothetical protein